MRQCLWVLINALTGQVGPGTQVTGYPTNQELAETRNCSGEDFSGGLSVSQVAAAGSIR
jgi:hypothetical protein